MLKKSLSCIFYLFSTICFALTLFFTSCTTSKKQQYLLQPNNKPDNIVKIIPKQVYASTLKRLYTNNKVVYLPALVCPYEFCSLYVVDTKKLIQTKTLVNQEVAEVNLEKEGIYYLKLVKRDGSLPDKLKNYDYKVIYDKTSPVLLIKSKILDKQIFKGNSIIRICYSSFDKNPKHIKVWFSDSYKGRSETFSNKLPKKGCFNFALPLYSTTLDFYFRAEDKCGNFSKIEKLTFFVDADAPDIAFDVPEITNSQNVDIIYTVFDKASAGFDFIEAFVKSSYFDLKKIGNFSNFKGKISYNFAKEGIYYFSLKAYDKVGNVRISEEKSVIYDATSPNVQVEGFDKDVFYAEELVRLKVTITDENPSNNMVLFLSSDYGKNWELLEFQRLDNDIFFRIPNVITKQAILRVEVKDKANNIGTWESKVFSIDNVIPSCEIAGNSYKFNTNEVRLDYKIVRMGLQPPDRVKLFYKRKEEKELKPYDFIYKFGDSLSLKLNDGIYKMGIICINTDLEKLGKMQSPETIKLVEVLIDTSAPKLVGISHFKRYYKNDDSIKLEWNFSEDNPQETEQVILLISYDGKNFYRVNKNFKYVDEFFYTIIGISKRLYFRIRAKDALNNMVTVTKSIRIDNTSPIYKFSIQQTSNIPTVPYELRLFDKGSGVRNAIVYIKKRGEERWEIGDSINFVKSKKGILNLKESGYYQVKVSAFDWAGNSSDDKKISSFDSEILVDIDPPKVDVESDRLEYFTGEVVHIKTKITDNIGIKNTKILLSVNNSPFEIIHKDYMGGFYEHKFDKPGIYHFKFVSGDYADNFTEKIYRVNVRKAQLNFPCPLPNIIKNKKFSFPCKLDIDTNIVQSVNIYIKKQGENEFKEFAEYFNDKEYLLPEGCYEIDIVGRDIGGNLGNVGENASKVCAVYTPPKISFLPLGRAIYRGDDSFVDLKWKVEAVETNKGNLYLGYSLDEGKTYKAIITDSNIIENFRFSLSNIRNFEGKVYFKVDFTDIGGDSAQDYINIYYDDIPPKIKLNSEFKKWFRTNEEFPLNYCVEDFDRNSLHTKLYYKINDNEYNLLKSDMPSCDTVNLTIRGENVSNTFKILAEDMAGNISIQETPKLYIDNTPPVIQLFSMPYSKEKNLKFSVKAQDNESGIKLIEIYKVSNDILQKIFSGDKKSLERFVYTVGEDGYYKFVAKVYDKVANVSESNLVDILVDTTKSIIDISKIGTDKINFCGIPIDLTIDFIDNLGMEYVKIKIEEGEDTVVDRIIKLNNMSRYVYTDRLSNISKQCMNYAVSIEVKDIAGNIETKSFVIKNIRPILSYVVDFGAKELKIGSIPYTVNIPDNIFPYLEKLELFGRKNTESQFRSFGYVQPKGIVHIKEEGCYEFVAIGYLSKDIYGNITGKTKVCFYDVSKIDIDVRKSYDVYSATKKFAFDYKISNFARGTLLYSFDNKEYKTYKQLSESGTILFNIPDIYEGIIFIRFEVENILGEKTFRQFEIKYDGIPPKVIYEWSKLNSQYYNADFNDILKVKCIDNYLSLNPLIIYSRNREGEEFVKVMETENPYTHNFNFGNYDGVQFKFICRDLGGNETEVITPFYIKDNLPPDIDISCQFIKKDITKGIINVVFDAKDNQSGVEEVEVSLYKDNSFYNLLYKGIEAKRNFSIDIGENGDFSINIIAKDKVGNVKKFHPPNCSFTVDLAPPKLEVNIPPFLKYPSNKVVEFSYTATDNVAIDSVELIEIVNEQTMKLYETKQPNGIFKIMPENRENLRKFRLITYDKSKNTAFYDFSISYKNLTLLYPIKNESYITHNTFNIEYELLDDIDLITDVLLYYSEGDNGKFIQYGSVMSNKKVTFKDGCYKLAVAAVSRLSEPVSLNKSNKRICVITNKPSIKVEGLEQGFYGRELVRIPFEVSSLELDDDSIKIFWSTDRGLSWKKINKLFKAKDELILTPEYEGNIYVKIYAKNKAGLDNELIIKNIFVSSQPPLCTVEDKLEFNANKINLKYRVVKRLIPLKEVVFSILKDGIEIKSITKNEVYGVVEVELGEGVYTITCSAYDIAGNYSQVNTGKVVVDYTPPVAEILGVDIEKVERNGAIINVRYRFSDNVSAYPVKLGIYLWDFGNDRWKQWQIFKGIESREGMLKVAINRFGKFSFALATVNKLRKRYIANFVLNKKPSPYVINLRKPKPKIYSPVREEVILQGESIVIKWNCRSRNSVLSEYVNAHIFNTDNSLAATIFTQYPTKGEYEYYPYLRDGEYFLEVVCKSKYGLEFSKRVKFYILEKLPVLKIKGQ